MSPRIEIDQECQYCELEQFYSPRRGVMRVTYVCHHPEKEGCLCILDPRVGGACIYFEEGEEPTEVEMEEQEKVPSA
jgi:hypothetical protein